MCSGFLPSFTHSMTVLMISSFSCAFAIVFKSGSTTGKMGETELTCSCLDVSSVIYGATLRGIKGRLQIHGASVSMLLELRGRRGEVEEEEEVEKSNVEERISSSSVSLFPVGEG